ncbi:MAG TPA: DUF5335 family protein [Stellaceae bacterium]|jgi:hypothetical protein|nr:DUF5335 family protein [Stellaceae bacterium]
MALRKPEKSEWCAYCDRLSKNLANLRSEQVTASLVVNHHGVAEWVPLLGITYESKKDLFEIMLQDLDHWIHRPETLYVDEGPKGVAALEIIDAAGVRHSLAISHPIKLSSMAKD